MLEGGVRQSDLNMNQPVQDIVRDYKTKVHEGTPSDPEVQTQPTAGALKRVRDGRLNPKTGQELPMNPKTRAVMVNQCCPNENYLRGYDGIRWD